MRVRYRVTRTDCYEADLIIPVDCYDKSEVAAYIEGYVRNRMDVGSIKFNQQRRYLAMSNRIKYSRPTSDTCVKYGCVEVAWTNASVSDEPMPVLVGVWQVPEKNVESEEDDKTSYEVRWNDKLSRPELRYLIRNKPQPSVNIYWKQVKKYADYTCVCIPRKEPLKYVRVKNV